MIHGEHKVLYIEVRLILSIAQNFLFTSLILCSNFNIFENSWKIDTYKERLHFVFKSHKKKLCRLSFPLCSVIYFDSKCFFITFIEDLGQGNNHTNMKVFSCLKVNAWIRKKGFIIVHLVYKRRHFPPPDNVLSLAWFMHAALAYISLSISRHRMSS